MKSVVTFNINDLTIGVDMLSVEKILKLFKIYPVPNSPEYLEGVTDIQNKIIPIINLKKKFEFPSKIVLPNSNLIILSDQSKKYGIIVDTVNDIIDVSNLDIVETQSSNYIYGVVNINGMIINLLDSNSLILDCIL